MTTQARARPHEAEVPPYYRAYMDLVPDGDVTQLLRSQIEETTRLLEPCSDSVAEYRYQPGKWSVKEVIGHLADTERVFAYRALTFARADTTPLPGFEQDEYVVGGGFGRRSLPDLLDEFRTVRAASIALFRSCSEVQWDARGTANGVEFSVRAIAWIVAGHELHHRRILEERYLVSNNGQG